MTALSGLRVIEITSEAVAFAGKLLADMGADVILVEPPAGSHTRQFPPFLDETPGENRSLYFWHYNTSKRSMVLDLDTDSGREDFQRLVDSADVLLEGEPPGRLNGLGIDFESLLTSNPRLIHAAVTPFGRNSTRSNDPAIDLTLMAEGGPPWSCGYDDHDLPPVRGWGNQAYHTGAHLAVMSVLTALLWRDTSGEGQFIDVSIAAALNVTTEAASYSWLVNKSTVQRQTGRHAATRPTGETQMLCADGRYVNTGVPPRFPVEFARLYQWMQDLGVVDDFPEAVFLEMGANWEGAFDLSSIGTDDTITAIFMAGRDALKLIASRISAYEFFTGCQNAGLSVGVIYSPEEAFEDPHFKARGFQVPVTHEDFGRDVVYPGAPYRFEKSPWAIRSRAPHVGEHTREILAELNHPD